MPRSQIGLLKKSEYDQRCWPTLNPFTRRDKQRTIKFVNTGPAKMYVYWIKNNGSAGPAIEIPRATERLRNSSTNILTQLGHWFLITRDPSIGDRPGPSHSRWRGGTDMKYIYIGPRFVNSSFFDIQSGFTFSNEHWSTLSKRLIRDVAPFLQDHIITQEEIIMKVEFLEKEGASLMEACETVAGLRFVEILAELVLQSRQQPENQSLPNEPHDDDELLQLAIKLSLEGTVGHMTSDVEEESGMGELFTEPDVAEIGHLTSDVEEVSGMEELFAEDYDEYVYVLVI